MQQEGTIHDTRPTRTVSHQHHPLPVGGWRAAGQFGTSRPAHGHRADGLHHLDPPSAAQPGQSRTGPIATASSCRAGMARMLLYSLLYLTGYDLPLDELKRFRQWGSLTPGHPEFGLTPGVEATTGPLGQGLSNGVGMAIAEAHLAAGLQPAGARDHRSLHLRHRHRRRLDGRRGIGSGLAGRPPESGQAHLSVRRQPHLHRRLHGPRVYRRPGQALRGLRLARAEGCGWAGRGSHRPGNSGCKAGPAAVNHHGAQHHRLRPAHPPGDVQGARRAAGR